MRWVMLAVVLGSGCVEPSVKLCSDGRTCGADTTCDVEHHLCISVAAAAACEELPDGMDCTFESREGVCSEGVCIEALCGDGVKIGLEECDGADLGGVDSCTALGFYDDGPITCTRGCRYDDSQCHRICGDGIKDDEERCDTAAPDGMDDCQDVGYYRSGPVGCNASCEPDVSQCQDKGYCGDGVLDPEESCDATPPIETCFDGGYDAGRMGCTKFCTPDYKDCKYIGWKSTLPGAQDNYSDILVTDASTYFLGTGNGFRKVVNKTPSFVTGINQQSINAMWGTGTDMWLAGGLGFIGHYDGTTITQKLAPSASDSDTLYGIWGSSNTNIYAAGNFRVLHNTGGASWPAEVNDLNTYYRSVWGTPNGSDVFAVGYTASSSYTIKHRLSNGTWQSESLTGIGSGELLLGVGGTGTEPIVLGAPGVIARRNGSGSWDKETYDVPAGASLTKLWARGANDMFVVGGVGEIGYYDGTWWRLITGITLDVTGIHGVGDDVYAIGGDKVFKHANASWSVPIPQGGQSIVAVSTQAADKTYVLSRDLFQVKTSGRFQGGVGPAAASGAPAFSSTIIASNMWVGGNAIAITSNENTGRGLPISSRVYRYNGTSWATDTFADAPNGSDLTSIAGSSTLLFVGGADGAIRRFNGTWAVESAAATGHRVNAIWSDAAGIAYAVGYGPGGGQGPEGEVRRRDATGTWTTMTLPTGTGGLSTVWASSKDDVFASGGPGPNNLYHYDGTSWTRMPTPSPYDIKEIAGTSHDDVFAVGSNVILHYDGMGWTELRIPAALAGGYEHVAVRPGLVLISGGGSSGVFALVRTGPW